MPAGEWVAELHRRVPHPPDLFAGGSVPTLSTDKTAVAALRRAEAEGMVGRVFPKDRDLEHLSLGSGSGEHCVSYAESSWMEWVKGSCGVPHPVLQHWPERVGWGLLALGGVYASGCAPGTTPPACRETQRRKPGRAENTGPGGEFQQCGPS